MRVAVIAALLAFAVPEARAQDLQVTCTGCQDQGSNRSVNLLQRKDASAPITLVWSSPADPAAGNRVVLLYAGNPELQDAIPSRGPLAFQNEAGRWKASMTFQGSELGKGTFLAVLTSRAKEDPPRQDGSNEAILDWRAFRLLTEEDRQRKERVPDPGGGWSITVTPALLQAQTGHGDLPRHLGGDERAWWSFVDFEGNTADLDLDGEHTGIPGLGVQVSSPWHARSETWKDDIRQKLGGVEGHVVHFSDLEWFEQPDRAVEYGDRKPISLRQYYTVVSLYTVASTKSFSTDDVGSDIVFFMRPFFHPTTFSHETSARLKHTSDPRFWASYSRRELSADRRLLEILRRHVEDGKPVPGATGIQRDDGDGGDPTYTVGFYAQVRPWDDGTGALADEREFRAGLVSVDVVAARAGIGGLATRGSGASSDVQRAWCKVVRCEGKDTVIDLDRPPDGYQATQPVAALGTIPGNRPLVDTEAKLAERAAPPASAPAQPGVKFPSRARFGLTARLRAGALLQEDSFGYAKNLVPIDVYTQFVVKLTVAVFKEHLQASEEATIPTAASFMKTILVPENGGFWAWVRNHLLAIAVFAILPIAVVVLAVVPGGLAVLSGVLGVVAKAARLVIEALSRAIDALRNLLKKKD